jgi:hypothetical protein
MEKYTNPYPVARLAIAYTITEISKLMDSVEKEKLADDPLLYYETLVKIEEVLDQNMDEISDWVSKILEG